MVKRSNKGKLVFSEHIKGIINAISILITYIVIGLLLYFENEFFGNVTKAIIIGFTIVGILGIVTEGRKLNISYRMKGFDNTILGSVLMVIFYLLRTYVNTDSYSELAVFVYQIVLFLFLLISIFVFCKGLIEMIYSVIIKSKDKGVGTAVSSVIIMIAQIIALFILILQLYTVFF